MQHAKAYRACAKLVGGGGFDTIQHMHLTTKVLFSTTPSTVSYVHNTIPLLWLIKFTSLCRAPSNFIFARWKGSQATAWFGNLGACLANKCDENYYGTESHITRCPKPNHQTWWYWYCFRGTASSNMGRILFRVWTRSFLSSALLDFTVILPDISTERISITSPHFICYWTDHQVFSCAKQDAWKCKRGWSRLWCTMGCILLWFWEISSWSYISSIDMYHAGKCRWLH